MVQHGATTSPASQFPAKLVRDTSQIILIHQETFGSLLASTRLHWAEAFGTRVNEIESRYPRRLPLLLGGVMSRTSVTAPTLVQERYTRVPSLSAGRF